METFHVPVNSLRTISVIFFLNLLLPYKHLKYHCTPTRIKGLRNLSFNFTIWIVSSTHKTTQNLLIIIGNKKDGYFTSCDSMNETYISEIKIVTRCTQNALK